MEITPAIEVHTPEEFAAWLAEYGATGREIWPIIYKKSSGKQTVTYPQLVEVGICYGWIDVLEKTVDSERYAIRFMPRRKGGNWTEANRALARRFIAEGRMTAAGMAALPPDLNQDGTINHAPPALPLWRRDLSALANVSTRY